MVRNAVLSDAERLAEIYAWYVERTAVTFEFAAPSPEEFRERMRGIMARYPYLVIEEEGRVLGYAYAGPFKGRAAYDWSCETTIYLDREARGRGLGRQLYEALEAQLQAMGILNLYACIAVPDEEDEYLTHASERFHAHLGYSLAGTFRQCACKFGRWYSMVWMEKHLGERRNDPPSVRWRTEERQHGG